jgi:hypothetical protein
MDHLDIDPIPEVLHCFSEDGIVYEFKEGFVKLPRRRLSYFRIQFDVPQSKTQTSSEECRNGL